MSVNFGVLDRCQILVRGYLENIFTPKGYLGQKGLGTPAVTDIKTAQEADPPQRRHRYTTCPEAAVGKKKRLDLQGET